MARYPQGPWHHHDPAGSQHSIGGYINASDDRQEPAICHVMGLNFNSVETQANAALLAAVPELLDMLEKCYESEWGYGLGPTHDEMVALIAKAKGGKS